MDNKQAETAVKFHCLVGTMDAGNCIFVSGYLIGEAKLRGGKKEREFVFKDRPKEITVSRPASEFFFV